MVANLPKEGTYFWDGLGNFSVMMCHMYYRPLLFKRPILYLPDSKFFSCERLATDEDLLNHGVHL